MQIPRISKLEESIFFIICGCLFNSVAGRLLHASSNPLIPRSILGTRNSGSEGSGKDQANTKTVPWCSQRDQFLPSSSVEDRCNCADFVPVRNFQSSAEEPSDINFKSVTRLFERILEILLKYVQKLLMLILLSIYKGLQNYCDVSAQISSVERIRNRLNASASRKSKDGMDRSKFSIVDGETSNKRLSIVGEGGSTNRIQFREYSTRLLSIRIDRSKEKFDKDETALEYSFDVARRQREKYAVNVCDRKNKDITWNGNDPCPHKVGSCSEIVRYNADDNLPRPSMKIKENLQSVLMRSLAEMFLATMIQDNDLIEAKGKAIDEGYSTKEEKKEDNGFCPVDDEMRSETPADKFEEHLTLTEESDKICSTMEDDYPGEQSGMLPEKGANSLEEESLMHSDRNATQFGAEGKEEDEELAPSPDAGSLKNCHKSDSVGFSDSPPIADHAKDKEDLNAIVRRMIVVELKKHQKKENSVLKRSHSDSQMLKSRKKQIIENRRHNCFRIGSYDPESRSFYQDLKQRLCGNSEDESNDSIKVKVDECATRRKESINQGENHSTNAVSEITDRANAAENAEETHHLIDSSTTVKRKIKLPYVMNAESEEEQLKDSKNTSDIIKEEQENKSTQTDRVYVIRSVRSCPLRKKRVGVQLQLHRLTDRKRYYSTTVYTSRDSARFLYRKASDDLIYEKGKGSRSPSYIPTPERFRWKYLAANKVKWTDQRLK